MCMRTAIQNIEITCRLLNSAIKIFEWVCSWCKTRIFAAQLLKKSIASKLEREHENNSQHQSNKVTQ